MSKKGNDPRDELVKAVLEMAGEIGQACEEDREWTSWEGNGTNAFEACNVIRTLEKIALRCK